MTTLEIVLTANVFVFLLISVWCWFNWDKWMKEYIKAANMYLQLSKEHLTQTMELRSIKDDLKREMQQHEETSNRLFDAQTKINELRMSKVNR